MKDGVVGIVVCSLPSYERLVAEIYIDDVFIGLVSEEEIGTRVFHSERPLVVEADLMAEAVRLAIERLEALDRPRS